MKRGWKPDFSPCKNISPISWRWVSRSVLPIYYFKSELSDCRLRSSRNLTRKYPMERPSRQLSVSALIPELSWVIIPFIFLYFLYVQNQNYLQEEAKATRKDMDFYSMDSFSVIAQLFVSFSQFSTHSIQFISGRSLPRQSVLLHVWEGEIIDFLIISYLSAKNSTKNFFYRPWTSRVSSTNFEMRNSTWWSRNTSTCAVSVNHHFILNIFRNKWLQASVIWSSRRPTSAPVQRRLWITNSRSLACPEARASIPVSI